MDVPPGLSRSDPLGVVVTTVPSVSVMLLEPVTEAEATSFGPRPDHWHRIAIADEPVPADATAAAPAGVQFQAPVPSCAQLPLLVPFAGPRWRSSDTRHARVGK